MTKMNNNANKTPTTQFFDGGIESAIECIDFDWISFLRSILFFSLMILNSISIIITCITVCAYTSEGEHGKYVNIIEVHTLYDVLVIIIICSCKVIVSNCATIPGKKKGLWFIIIIITATIKTKTPYT